MANNTQTDSGMPAPPAVLSGQEIYDSIMKDIEPELLTANLQNLTAEQKTLRKEHYDECFAEYDKRFAQYKSDWDNALRTYKREAIAHLEDADRGDESNQLSVIESSLAS
jgi:hypothetical protein